MNISISFHVLTPLLKRVQTEGWSKDIIKAVDYYLVMIRSIPLIQRLLKDGYRPSTFFTIHASVFGYLDLIQFAKENHFPYSHQWSLKAAVKNRRIECLEYLIKSHPKPLLPTEAEELLNTCIFVKHNQHNEEMITFVEKMDSFRCLVENGFQPYVTNGHIYTACHMELAAAEQYQDYSFSFTNYFYQKQMITASRIIDQLDFWLLKERFYKQIDFRLFLNTNPAFRYICLNHDLTNYGSLREKIEQLKTEIQNEKEETKILQHKVSNDIIQYIVCSYI